MLPSLTSADIPLQFSSEIISFSIHANKTYCCFIKLNSSIIGSLKFQRSSILIEDAYLNKNAGSTSRKIFDILTVFEILEHKIYAINSMPAYLDKQANYAEF